MRKFHEIFKCASQELKYYNQLKLWSYEAMGMWMKGYHKE